MKKAIGCSMLVLLMIFSLAGCSGGEKKTEEQLKAEIKAELQAEMSKEQVQNNSQAASGTPAAASKIDMKNMDAIYEFVKKEIVNVSRESFNTWEVYYFDVTGNGTEDVVLASPYGAEWHDKLEIISGDSGQLQRIDSSIPLGKYGSQVEFGDGFLSVTTASGGTGETFLEKDIFVYNNGQLIKATDNSILVEHRVAFPDADFEETALMDGSLYDFSYVLSKYDNKTGKTTVVKEERYIYNSSKMRYDITPLDVKQGSNSQPANAGGGGELYLSQLKNGDDVGGGFTITDIRYTKGGEKAIFTLKGETVLVGKLYFEEMSEQIAFVATDLPDFSTVIAIEVPGDVVRYKPDYVGFKNYDEFLKNFSASELDSVKNGSELDVKIRVKDFRFIMEYYSGSGTESEFVSLIDKTKGSSSQSSEGALLNIYETNKEYKLFDLNKRGAVDTFKVVQSNVNDPQYYIYLLVNGQRFDFSGVEPELVFHKYKITKNVDDGHFVIVLQSAIPPNGPDEVYFYEYSPNYSVEMLGYITPNIDIESMDIQHLNYSEVIINNKTYALQ